MRVLAALLIFATVAGCVDGKDPAPEPEPQEAPIEEPPRSFQVMAPVGGGNGTGGFELNAQGDGGTWIIVYHPFPTWENGVGYGYTVNLKTEGSNQDSLWIPPSATVVTNPENGTFMLEEWGPFFPFEEHHVLRGGALDINRAGGVGIGHYLQLHGLFMAFGSTAPWSLQVSVIWDDGQPVGAPEYVSSGENFTFNEGSTSTVPVAGGPADIVSFSWDAPAGWNHVELMDYRVEPDGVRQHDVSFPSGYRVQGMGTQTGYWVPMLMGSAGSSGWMDYAGAFRDEPGTISGEVTYAQTGLFFNPVTVNMPVTEWPPKMEGNGYWGSTWPFHDIPIPTPPPYWQMPYEDAIKPGIPIQGNST